MKKGKHRQTEKRSNAGLFAVIIIFILLAAAYGAGAVYYSSHFFNETTLNNCDVSGLTGDEAKAKLIEASENYVLTLQEQDSKFESISGEEIGLEAVVSDSFGSLVANQGGFAWILHLFDNKQYILDESILTYSYDVDSLTEIIDNLGCVNPEYPVEASDAELVLMDGEFKIIPESESNIAHRDELEEKILLAIETQQDTLNLIEEDLYDKPSVYSYDPYLLAKRDILDGLVDFSVDMIFGYCEEYIDIQDVIDWIEVVEDENGEYYLTVDDDEVKAYVLTLSNKYDSSGKTIQFATSGGDVVELTAEGDYGWILDNSYVEERIKEYLNAGQSKYIDLTDGSEESDEWWIQKGVGFDANGNDVYGTTYAEVSITEQHMWMYQDGEVALETDVVTGNPTSGNDTPEGAFRIRYKDTDATLTGETYSTPVAFWMVFADDVGFHDATWQSSFGGSRYLTNGSHGCVNMPLDMAEKLYDLVYVGMPVFVYSN